MSVGVRVIPVAEPLVPVADVPHVPDVPPVQGDVGPAVAGVPPGHAIISQGLHGLHTTTGHGASTSHHQSGLGLSDCPLTREVTERRPEVSRGPLPGLLSARPTSRQREGHSIHHVGLD